MRFCLAFAFQNEAHWLGLHLPKLLEANSIDGVVTLDGGSDDDGPQIVRSVGASVYERPFDWQFGKHKNALIEHCEDEGYETMLLLDPDELMFPTDIDLIASTLAEGEIGIRFPTYHFEKDRYHWRANIYPDPHIRAWRLDKNPVRYEGTIHEWPHREGELVQAKPLPIHLFHYGGIHPHNERYYLKQINYRRLQNGKPPLSALPQNAEMGSEYQPREPFEKEQPLDPDIIGAKAPFGDDVI